MHARAEKHGKPAAHAAKGHPTLGQLAATAICGNDITSSCLYVSALAILYAGPLAPLALLLVAVVLYLFRAIYAEVVGALPLNGGAYNALLNTTSKFRASVAACLTILSYMATAVISANEAVHYVHDLWAALPITGSTIGLLATFCGLTILGISDSARVAIVIFAVHLFTLALLLVVGLGAVMTHGLDVFFANMDTPPPGGFAMALFFGFSASMLGISGFESSANFVEEQQPGVFPKTLRNMWIAVSFFNPVMALLVLGLVEIPAVGEHKEALLAHVGAESGGSWLATLVSVDAALVLSGAVLTAFVGVNGLVHRMTLDRCLPQFLLKSNRRGTTHRILIGFFVLAVSVLLITEGDLEALAGVYTISFLAVMALFGIGNVLLKVKRAKLPRPSSAPWLYVLVGVSSVVAALIGNAVMNPSYLRVFLEYFVPVVLFVSIMLGRIALLKAGLYILRQIVLGVTKPMGSLAKWIREKIDLINAQQVVFFTHGDDIDDLNEVMLYLRKNEHTNRLKLVTVVANEEDVPSKVKNEIRVLDRAYPEIDIEFVVLEGEFGPELIRRLSAEWGIPMNLMFIGSPAGKLEYGLGDLGGVRLII
ncbi:MAG: APC family permease [Planctomycetes bacterium]|nr:APC family permease [Planctomycetota bacterium]